MPPSIWPSTAVRLERVADVLRGADPDDAREAELDVDLDDDAHRGDRERDVRLPVGDLARLGIERERARVAVDALDVDRAAARALALLERGAARASAPRRPPSTSSARPRTSRPSRRAPSSPRRAVTSSVPSSSRATWRMTSLTPWPTSAAAQCTSAEPSSASTTRAAQ